MGAHRKTVQNRGYNSSTRLNFLRPKVSIISFAPQKLVDGSEKFLMYTFKLTTEFSGTMAAAMRWIERAKER